MAAGIMPAQDAETKHNIRAVCLGRVMHYTGSEIFQNLTTLVLNIDP